MNETENINGGINYYPMILVFTIISNIAFLFYISSVIFYIIKNYHRKKLCIFWIDYCFLILGGILFTFIYLVYLIFFYPKEKDEEKMLKPSEIKNKFFPIILVISLSLMFFTLIATLLFDAIISIRLALKMNKMKLINEMDLDFLAEKLNNIDYEDILKMKSHHIYTIVFLIINLVLIIIEILAYLDLSPERKLTPWNLRGYFDYLLRFYHLIVMIFLIISMIIMNYSKKSLLRKNYHNPNRIAQKVYDAHFSQIIYFTDILSFKLVADLIMNIPPILFMSSAKFDSWTLIVSEIAIFLYIFFGGSEYFVIDRHSKAGRMNKFIQIFFCLKKLDFHFGEKDVRSIFDQIKFDYSKEEKNILDNLNIKIIKNVEYNLLKDENENSFSNSNIELQITK